MAGAATPPLPLPKRVRVAVAKRARSLREPYRVVMRARIVMLAVEGMATAAIARELGVGESMVRKWRGRMAARPQVSSLYDAPRSGRPPEVPVAARCELVKLACQRPEDRPKVPLEQVWTRPLLQQALFEETGVWLSLSEITRTLRCGGLRPHRIRQWLHTVHLWILESHLSNAAVGLGHDSGMLERPCSSPCPRAIVTCPSSPPGFVMRTLLGRLLRQPGAAGGGGGWGVSRRAGGSGCAAGSGPGGAGVSGRAATGGVGGWAARGVAVARVRAVLGESVW